MAGVCVCIAAVSLSAGTIDVSSQTSLTLQSGDSLEFLFSWSSFANYSTGTPQTVCFTFSSLAVIGGGNFAAALESQDGAASAAFPTPGGWTSGYMQNSSYTGPVDSLTDTLSLSSGLSASVFSSPDASLVLTYSGPEITVGIPGRTLRQDMMVSLWGQSMTVGGMVQSVALDDPPAPNSTPSLSAAILPASPAPEPDAAALMLAAGVAMCGLAAALRRFGIKPVKPV